MLKKIDVNILNKIFINAYQSNNIEIIVKVNSFKNSKKLFNKYTNSDIVELPFISCVSFKTNIKNIYKIARYNFVGYISENSRVTSLVYNAKKFINFDAINSYELKYNNHACVVIDTGVYPHIDLVLGKNKIIEFIDLINHSKNMYDDNGHGTFVTGVISGAGIVDKYAGYDNKCNLIVIKALDNNGETTTSKILEAMQWVVKNKTKFNIKIVCMSFGSVRKENDPLMYGAEMLWNNGIVVVTAAGNNGPEYNTIMSPGADKKVITVGALDTSNENNFFVADFSSRGPVKNYYKPDVVVPGVDVISCNVFSKDKKFYTAMTGTSMATPMVAGIVSLLFSINPNYTPNQIKYMLVNSCIEINGDRNSEGFGRLDLSKLKILK